MNVWACSFQHLAVFRCWISYNFLLVSSYDLRLSALESLFLRRWNWTDEILYKIWSLTYSRVYSGLRNKSSKFYKISSVLNKICHTVFMAWHRHTSLTNLSSSRVRVSKASAFRFVSWTVWSPYPTLNLRRPSFSSRRCTDLEQSSAAYHICTVTSHLLLSLEDILFQTLLPVITVVVPAKWHCHLWTR